MSLFPVDQRLPTGPVAMSNKLLSRKHSVGCVHGVHVCMASHPLVLLHSN